MNRYQKKSFRIYIHFKFKMRLSWYHVCYTCQAPLNPRIVTRGKENKDFVRYYKHIRPLFTYNNEQYYSFVGGLKVQRVCYSCFRSKAKTEKEILFWFDGLLRRAVKEGIDIRK